jgi:hypothetical protein
MNKKFTSNSIKEIVYEVVGEGWMDKDTYLVVFQTMTDIDGDDFHMEAEYHKGENEIFYTRCYDEEVIDGTMYVSPCFKKQIEEYILKQVGRLREGSFISKQKVEIELTLDVPLDMIVGEFKKWLKDELKVSVMTPIDSKVEILKIEKK